MGAEERGQLIPGLPQEVVLAELVPRLPWYTRPLCRALSKTWKAILDTKIPELDRRTRMFQVPLLRGLFLFCTFDKQIFVRDDDIHGVRRTNLYQIQPGWRKLPPVNDLLPSTNTAVMCAGSGMVYVWLLADYTSQVSRIVAKLDMGCADWTWKKVPVPYRFNDDATVVKDKIYVSKICEKSSADPQNIKEVVLVHDMLTDTCKPVETWNQDQLRVVSKCTHSTVRVEEMNGLKQEALGAGIRIRLYDAKNDSWRAQEEVLIAEEEVVYTSLVQLLNNDCFEPALATGMNVVWYNQMISWFKSSAGICWVDIALNSSLEGKCLENLRFIRGSLYGIFCDELDEEEDTEEDKDGDGLSIILRRYIMKARILVESNRVVWEEVHEVGFFQKEYKIDLWEHQPVDWYTSMA